MEAIDFQKLQAIEVAAKKSISRAKNYLLWRETTGANYQRKWDNLMVKLRGWSEHQSSCKHNTTWLDYCKRNGLYPNYNFNDVLS